MYISTGCGVHACQTTYPDNQLNFNPSPVGPALPDANNKQLQLNHSAEVLAKCMKDVYGADKLKERGIWGERVLKEIAETGGFNSTQLNKYVKVSPETQQAAKFIMQNGGPTLFDREGNEKDGKFHYDDLKHYISEHPPKNTSNSCGGFRDEGTIVHVYPSYGHHPCGSHPDFGHQHSHGFPAEVTIYIGTV